MPAPESGLVDLAGMAEFLKVSESTTDRLRRDGMPHYNLSPNGNGKRPRKQELIRYDPTEVLAWLRERRAR